MLGLGNTLSAGVALDEFTAASISSLDLWYDFSALTGSDEDEISDVSNKGDGGSNYDLAPPGAEIPTLDTSTLNLNSIKFDNGGERFQLDNHYTTTGQTFSIFVVYKRTNITDTDLFLAGQTSGRNQFYLYSNNRTVVLKCNGDGGSSNSHGTVVCNNTNNSSVSYEFGTGTEIIVLTRDASEVIKVYNQAGNFIGQGTNPTTSSDTNIIIDFVGAQSGQSNPYGGNVGEVGVYNKTLSADEVSSLITHLVAKWGI